MLLFVYKMVQEQELTVEMLNSLFFLHFFKGIFQGTYLNCLPVVDNCDVHNLKFTDGIKLNNN